MKVLLIAAALLALSTTSSFAAITCWYNEAFAYTGADDAQPGFAVGQVKRGNPNTDYAWGYTVAGGPETCPRRLPGR